MIGLEFVVDIVLDFVVVIVVFVVDFVVVFIDTVVDFVVVYDGVVVVVAAIVVGFVFVLLIVVVADVVVVVVNDKVGLKVVGFCVVVVDVSRLVSVVEVVVTLGCVEEPSSHSRSSFSSPSLLSRQNTLLVAGSWSLRSPRQRSLVIAPPALLVTRTPCSEVITVSHARSSSP